MRGGHSVNESTLLLQDLAYQQIKAAINEGEFNRDEIFSLNTLAKKLNMSKTPVRDAVQRLSREGMLDILPSRGIRIAQYTPHEIVELFQTRFVITDFCCTMLALRHKENPDHPIFRSMEEALQEQEQITDGDFGKFFEADWKFHMMIIDACDNAFFTEDQHNRKEVFRHFAFQCEPHNNTVTAAISEHREIYEGICEDNILKCRLASLKHLDRTLRGNLQVTEEVEEYIRKMLPVELLRG